jgi:hypothetical protein
LCENLPDENKVPLQFLVAFQRVAGRASAADTFGNVARRDGTMADRPDDFVFCPEIFAIWLAGLEFVRVGYSTASRKASASPVHDWRAVQAAPNEIICQKWKVAVPPTVRKASGLTILK